MAVWVEWRVRDASFLESFCYGDRVGGEEGYCGFQGSSEKRCGFEVLLDVGFGYVADLAYSFADDADEFSGFFEGAASLAVPAEAVEDGGFVRFRCFFRE